MAHVWDRAQPRPTVFLHACSKKAGWKQIPVGPIPSQQGDPCPRTAWLCGLESGTELDGWVYPNRKPGWVPTQPVPLRLTTPSVSALLESRRLRANIADKLVIRVAGPAPCRTRHRTLCGID